MNGCCRHVLVDTSRIGRCFVHGSGGSGRVERQRLDTQRRWRDYAETIPRRWNLWRVLGTRPAAVLRPCSEVICSSLRSKISRPDGAIYAIVSSQHPGSRCSLQWCSDARRMTTPVWHRPAMMLVPLVPHGEAGRPRLGAITWSSPDGAVSSTRVAGCTGLWLPDAVSGHP